MNAGTCEYTCLGSKRSSTRAHVASDQRLQPALGAETIKRIAVRAGRDGGWWLAVQPICQTTLGLSRRACTRLAPSQRQWFRYCETIPATGASRARANSNPYSRKTISVGESTVTSAIGNQLLNARDRTGEALSRGMRVNRTNQSRRQITVIAKIKFLAAFGALCYLVQLPLDGILIEARHALAHHLGSSAAEGKALVPQCGTGLRAAGDSPAKGCRS